MMLSETMEQRSPRKRRVTKGPLAGPRRPALRTETVTPGTHYAGKINQTDRGFETFDASDRYLATHVSIQAARRALFELHQESRADGQQA